MSKKRYLKARYPQQSDRWCLCELQGAKDEVNTFLHGCEPGELLTFELVELTDEEVNAMPKFEGW